MEEARTDGAGSWLGAVGRPAYVRSKHPLAPHSCPQSVHKGADNVDGAPRSVRPRGVRRADSKELTRRATVATSRSACNPMENIRSRARRVGWTPLVGSARLRRGWFDPLGAPPVPLGGRCPQRPLSAVRSLTDAGATDRSSSRCQPLKMWEFSREQAHFPAKQPAPQPHPWLSSADEDPRRSRDPRCPPAQGSRRVVGLIESFSRRRCCRDSTGCAARRISGGRRGGAYEQVAPASSSMPGRRRAVVACASASSSAARSETRSSAIG